MSDDVVLYSENIPPYPYNNCLSVNIFADKRPNFCLNVHLEKYALSMSRICKNCIVTSCVQVLPRGVAETQVLPVQLHPARRPHQHHRALRLPHPRRVRGEGDAVNS